MSPEHSSNIHKQANVHPMQFLDRALVGQLPQLLQLVLDIHCGGLHLERAVTVQHNRNVLLAADGHGTVGSAFLFLNVVPSVCRPSLSSVFLA